MTTNGLNLDLSAGFARIDITPSLGTPIVGYFKERRAKGILDPLEANALALSDGERTAVVIAADLLGIEGIEFKRHATTQNRPIRRNRGGRGGMIGDTPRETPIFQGFPPSVYLVVAE